MQYKCQLPQSKGSISATRIEHSIFSCVFRNSKTTSSRSNSFNFPGSNRKLRTFDMVSITRTFSESIELHHLGNACLIRCVLSVLKFAAPATADKDNESLQVSSARYLNE